MNKFSGIYNIIKDWVRLTTDESELQHGYPLYQQLINACGLTSVLMILHHSRIVEDAKVLDDLNKILTPLIDEIEPDLPYEFKLQYALQYLLLKIYGAGSPKYGFLKEILEEAFPQEFLNHLAIIKYQMKQNQQSHLFTHQYQQVEGYDHYFLEDFHVSIELLKEQTHMNKLDLDIKLLLTLFGFKFLPQQVEDGTGTLSLSYTSEKEYVKKIEFYTNSPTHHLICGKTAHWMIVVGIEKKDRFFKAKSKEEKGDREKIHEKSAKFKEVKLIMHNPLKKNPQEYKLEDIAKNFLFYVFEKKESPNAAIWEKFNSITQQTVPEECHLILAARKMRELNFDPFD